MHGKLEAQRIFWLASGAHKNVEQEDDIELILCVFFIQKTVLPTAFKSKWFCLQRPIDVSWFLDYFKIKTLVVFQFYSFMIFLFYRFMIPTLYTVKSLV